MTGWFKSRKRKATKGLPEELAFVQLQAFPNGDKQIDEEARSLQETMNGKLSFEEARGLVTYVKVLLVVVKDKSLRSVVGSIVRHEKGRLTEADAKHVYGHITGVHGPLFSGGDGTTPEQAVVINCSITSVGQYAEHLWLSQHLGTENNEWSLQSRFHGERPNGEAFETFVVTTKNGQGCEVHFNISQWYLKN